PLSTITNWTLEFEKWAPSVKVIVYKGSQQQRRSLQPEIRYGNFQVLLTTYEYIIRERPLLAKFHYSHMIIDEGHRMKNSQSKLSQTLRTYYKTKNRLILTGTPLQNNLPELWALLNFVLPGIFNSVKSFDDWFNTPFANTGNQEKIELTEEESLLIIRRLHKVLRPFLLRRLKKDVEKDLPDKVEKVLKCNLSGLQYVLYQQMLKHNALFVGADVGGAKSGIKGLNNKIMQLRKICNHPFVFEEVEAVLNSSRLTNDLIWRVSGKFELLDRILPKFKKSGHRVLMFFQMTQVMDIMEDFLRWRNMKYLRLDGGTKAEDRQDMLKVFNAPDSEYFCFLLSTRAGGLGLNLQTADTVVIFDTDWNPHQDLQAQDRAHRIGQKNEVRILRLITNDSVEEMILERAHQKLDIDGKVIQAGKFDNKSTPEEQEAMLMSLITASATDAVNEEDNSLEDDELNEILARSEEEKALFAAMDEERKLNDVNLKSRLIEKDELPSVFTEDISKHFEKDNKELTKMREKKRVRYDDGLSEEQWLRAMDDDNDTVEDAIKRKERRMAKRKRNKAIREGLLEEDIKDDEVGEEDDVDFAEAAQPRKRQRRERTPLPHIEDGVNGIEEEEEEEEEVVDGFVAKCLVVIDEITALTDENDGHNLSDIFIKLPSRKLYPDYYSIIKKPVSINQVKKQLNQDKFASFEEFIAELKQMCLNAKTYNEEGSFVYTDATVIEKLLDEKLAEGDEARINV
ncbi:Nuclear protein STH1/NPS1, partial [Candida tropicalis]